MKLSKLWLSEWVNFSYTEHELAAQLTMAGLEVDGISPVAGMFTGVFVAEVLNTKLHPDADKLTLCEVAISSEKKLQIVCGAANVRPGLKVALATVGAVLPGNFKIKESKLRGQLSQGMLCSAAELGMEEHSEGIMELECDAPLGVDLRDYLMLDDRIIDVDLTPNRADCFSVLGIAREVALLNKSPLLETPIKCITPTIDDQVSVHLKNPEACPHYCGRVIRAINPDASTPLWMSERLRRSGIRAIHPVVDVMNYVMLELGQPMHAFDLARIKHELNIRYSKEKEQITLLDGQKVTLDEKILVIADQEKPLAMAGIMGGLESSVQAHTRDVFLESAFFNPQIIAGIARKFGLFSESSQRYERGVDPNLQIKALERATALILSITGGEPGPIIEAQNSDNFPKPITFTFDSHKVRKLTGLTISQEEIKRLLIGIGITIHREHQQFFEVSIPLYRFDIRQEVDLVEEVIRLYGYNHLKAEPMQGVIKPGSMCAEEKLTTYLANWFSNKGYHEIISYSFVDPSLQEAIYPHSEFMQLLNPISSELSQMRAGMWPGLIASMIYNIHRQQNCIKFFELGVVFDLKKQQVTERPCIAGLLTGEQGGLNWSETERFFDFFDLKGDLQSLFAALKLNQVEFLAAAHEALHPGQSAQIMINGVFSGWIGVLHPRLADVLDLQQDVVLFELSLDNLIVNELPRFKIISKYPQIRRDLSFLVDKNISIMQIETTIKETIKENWLKTFDVFDLYTGQNIPEGKKSLAIAMILQDDHRTLVDTEINFLIGAIIKRLENKFSIILRE
jgi:phenylalanyl-tRNA synthetase beta chain